MAPFEPAFEQSQFPAMAYVKTEEYLAMQKVCEIAAKAIGFVPVHTTLREDLREAIDELRKVRGK